MYKKRLFVLLVTFSLLYDITHAKRSRRTKRPKPEDDETTPQPSVVSYSTFGFNDVGGYDGFVPSSPDYVNYLSSYNNKQPESSTTRLYAPAFPTAQDTVGYYNNEDHRQDTQGTGQDNQPQASMLQYQSSIINNPFPMREYDSSEIQSKNVPPEELYRYENAPLYGTKLSSKNIRNSSDYEAYGSAVSGANEDKYSILSDPHPTQETKATSYSESASSYGNFRNYIPNHAQQNNEETQTEPTNMLKFPRVVDFTNIKQYYPKDVETKYPSGNFEPINTYGAASNSHIDIIHEDNRNKFSKPIHINYNNKEPENSDNSDDSEKDSRPSANYPVQSQGYSQNYLGNAGMKNNMKPNKPVEFKDKFKYNKPWSQPNNQTDEIRVWNHPSKGYGYSTGYSNITFKFDLSATKKPDISTVDELVPASSNLVDSHSNYKTPETDYSSYKNYQNANFDEELTKSPSYNQPTKYKPDTDELINQYKHLYSKSPSISNLWENNFKAATEHSPKYRKPQAEDPNDDIVHIPKRQYGSKYNWDQFDYKPKYRPGKSNKSPYNPPKKEGPGNRFKTEEDLLRLRTHETSQPSYLPSYKPFSDIYAGDDDYKKLIEKWKQSYLKSKYKDALQDYESYASDTKSIHVPVPKPYAIEVPHPIIVPVPQPYPVRVPIPKPVMVPIIHELTVPIEKPVPYPVVKNVPYPVEKLVPVTIEKEVQVQVEKPYPVPIPHIRPVFHHSRPHDFDSDSDDDDYMPRPDHEHKPKKVSYPKRYRGSYTRSRKPSRSNYQDRNRRRWPSKRPVSSRDHRQQWSRYPQSYERPSYNKYHDAEEDYDQRELMIYCKRTGNC